MKEPPQFMIVKSRQHPECNGGYTIETGKWMNELPVFKHAPEKGRNMNQKFMYFDGLCWCISSSIEIGRAEADCTSTRRPQLRMPDSSAWPEAQVRGVKNTKQYNEWKDSRVALFTDPEFPPQMSSIGESELGEDEIVWARAQDCMDGHLCLFDTISPSDICQGALGDCWLMASCAALAEFPPRVEDLFVTKKVNPAGKYEIRLWDVNTQDWQIVTVSDMIPCHERNPWETHPMPLFAQCDHAELWTMLLEKSFAKLAGSYGALKGGRPELALQALTGCKEMWCFQHLGDGTWQKMYIDAPKGKPRDFKNIQGEKAKDAPVPTLQFFEMLKGFDHSNYLMITLIESDGEKKRSDGLVAGHAYSLISVEEAGGHHFVKLRNPWGNDVEWNGKWADTDRQSWLANPAICLQLQGKEFQEQLMDKDGPQGMGDGIFWMEFEEYQQNYTQVTVCPKDMGEVHAG
jgi:calpain-15